MTCPNCGAELKNNNCEYCGYTSTSGTCPKCNSKKISFKRERIGKDTSGNARYRTVGLCGDCGYTWTTQEDETIIPKKKKSVVFWILAVLFFPITLSIWFWKTDVVKLKKTIKAVILVIFWILLFATSSNDSTNSDNQPVESIVTESPVLVTVDPIEETKQEEVVATAEPIVYVKDEVVNRFITEFNEVSIYDIADIRNGNIREKNFCYINDCYTELLNSNDALSENFNVTINGGQTADTRTKILETFKEVVKVFEPSVSEEEIQVIVSNIENENTDYYTGIIGDSLSYKYYPFVELSKYTTDCRIELSDSNYK